MSSTNRNAIRVTGDAYLTPDHIATACVGVLPRLGGQTAWEPHAGAGAFCRALRAHGAMVYASDIAEHPIEGADVWASEQDATDGFPFAGPDPDWIVGNPPFDGAEEHVRMAIQRACVGAAFLLRLAFVEGADRYRTFWRSFPAAEIHTFVRRPAFWVRRLDGTIGPLQRIGEDGEIVIGKRGKPLQAGTDSAAYAFFVWRRGYVGETIHRFLTWEDP